jgi:hypothetical protein
VEFAEIGSMRRYRVFVGAPRVLASESSSTRTDTGTQPPHWHTVSYNAQSGNNESESLGKSVSYSALDRSLSLLSTGDIEFANQNISTVYKGVIFREDEPDGLHLDNEESLDQGESLCGTFFLIGLSSFIMAQIIQGTLLKNMTILGQPPTLTSFLTAPFLARMCLRITQRYVGEDR